MKRPTITDLAKAAGVSPTTVSHAYSGKRHVDAETRTRIIQAAQTMGYHPNRAAQGLRRGRTGTLAIASCVPPAVAAGPSRLGFLMEIAASAAIAAFEHDHSLCLIPPISRGRQPGPVSGDGVILLEPEQADPLVDWFEARRIPIVSIGKVPGRPDIPAVDLHSGGTARLLLDHLHNAGSRSIGLITGTARRTSHIEAEAAYDDFARQHSLAPVKLRLDENGGADLAAQLGGEFLQAHPELDGLLVPVDAFATGVLKAAKTLGRSVPAALRIATRYDGLRAKLSNPPLTAVNLGLAEIAAKAVELLLALLEGSSGNEVAPQATLVRRESTAVTAWNGPRSS